MAKNEKPQMDELQSQVRDLVQQLLEQGASPCDVSFGLTTIAAELGFHTADERLAVIPALLSAILYQTAQHLSGENDAADDIWAEGPNDGETVH
jgi:hypothetical protein